jgi:two-component system, sensor histidine kinase ChiS
VTDSLKVLIVDDSELQILFEKEILEQEHITVSVARNGQAGFDMARELRPDLILMDIVMPVMDGIATVQALRADPTTCDIPIVMVTSQSELDYMEGAFVGGCNDYVIKPVVKEELLAKISSLTGRAMGGLSA